MDAKEVLADMLEKARLMDEAEEGAWPTPQRIREWVEVLEASVAAHEATKRLAVFAQHKMSCVVEMGLDFDIEEMPACDCGLDAARAAWRRAEGGE